MLDQVLPEEAFGFLLVMTRLAPLTMIAPAIGDQSIPRRIRVAFAALIALVIYSSVRSSIPLLPDSLFQLATLVVGELFIGSMIGITARFLMTSTHVAGTVIAFQTGLAAAQSFDPNQGGQSVIIATFMTLLAVTLIIISDIHHLLIMGTIQSYTKFPVGLPVPYTDFASVALHYVSNSFELGLRMAAPFLIYGLMYNLGLGLIARMIPQLQVFFIGQPLNIFLGFALLMLILSSLMLTFLDRFEAFTLQLVG